MSRTQSVSFCMTEPVRRVIESGNRSVMQERLKLPGMRWSVESAQFVLTLKCKYDSNLWESVVVPLIYNLQVVKRSLKAQKRSRHFS